MRQPSPQRPAVNQRNMRWYDQVLIPINLQEPNFPVQRYTAQRIAAIRYGHVAHVLQSSSCEDLNHHCCLWPAARLQSFSSRSLSRPTSQANLVNIEEVGKALDASSPRMLVEEFSYKNSITLWRLSYIQNDGNIADLPSWVSRWLDRMVVDRCRHQDTRS